MRCGVISECTDLTMARRLVRIDFEDYNGCVVCVPAKNLVRGEAVSPVRRRLSEFLNSRLDLNKYVSVYIEL